MSFLPDTLLVNFIILGISFAILTKSADFLVDGAVGIAFNLKVPKVIIGIVLVSFGTTSPEFTVSLISAMRGLPGIALGNAVGSVIVNSVLAFALAVLVAPVAIKVDRRMLKSTGLVLIGVCLISYAFSIDGKLTRWEGIVLLAGMVGYLAFLLISERRAAKKVNKEHAEDVEEDVEEHHKPGTTPVQVIRFLIGLAGVIIASRFLVDSAESIAHHFGVPEIVIGLTVIAIGTSLPEIATCVVASRKGHGDLAFGDIIGANILNILWIVGAASAANPISVSRDILLFAFPSMLIAVIMVLVFGAMGHKFQKWKGVVLLSFYLVYSTFMIGAYYTGWGQKLIGV